jgi:ABC-type nitrate/sulfonate/bicarbonate transport system permease component
MSSRFPTKVLRYAISISLLITLWTFAAHFLPGYLLPRPSIVLHTLWHERPSFVSATEYTLTNALSGAAIGISLGILTGLCIAYSKMLRWVVEPYLIIFQSFPRESLFPLLIVWLGFGSATKIVNAALLSFFPIAVMTLNGLLDVREDYLTLIRGWGANRMQEFLWCRLPAVIPTLVSAVKVALPLALIGAVLGEFMGANRGLGYLIISSGSEFRVDRLFGAIVILALIGSATLVGVQFIQSCFLTRFNQE